MASHSTAFHRLRRSRATRRCVDDSAGRRVVSPERIFACQVPRRFPGEGLSARRGDHASYPARDRRPPFHLGQLHSRPDSGRRRAMILLWVAAGSSLRQGGKRNNTPWRASCQTSTGLFLQIRAQGRSKASQVSPNAPDPPGEPPKITKRLRTLSYAEPAGAREAGPMSCRCVQFEPSYCHVSLNTLLPSFPPKRSITLPL